MLYGDELQSGRSNVWVAARLVPKNWFKRSMSVEEQLSSGGARWADSYVLDGPTTCKVEVQVEWVYRSGAVVEYTTKPSIVPVIESVFSAYGQFAALLPGYAEQVLERLEPKENEGFLSVFTRILPYRQTDGRYLHRYLRKEEEDLQIYKG